MVVPVNTVVNLEKFLFLLDVQVTMGLSGGLSSNEKQVQFWHEIGKHEDNMRSYNKEFPIKTNMDITVEPGFFNCSCMGGVSVQKKESIMMKPMAIAWSFIYASYLLMVFGLEGAENHILNKRYKK